MLPSNLPFKHTLSFEDVLLAPKYSEINSRRLIDLSSNMSGHSFSLPIISSPMDTVTESAMAITMSAHGGLGVIHRYNTVAEQASIVADATRARTGPANKIAAAIGVTGDFLERAIAIHSEGGEIICIDVAHGHHINVERALKTIKDSPVGDKLTIIAGNVAMPEAFVDISSWGADAIRVGIGGGSICSTRLQTGHGIPTFQSVVACYIAKKHSGASASLIADGGIKNTGDIVKALAAGADFAMLGSMLAGSSDTPGQTFTNNQGNKYKIYRGMASPEAQLAWRDRVSSLEGVSTTIPHKGSTSTLLSEIRKNVQSGFSYSGAQNVDDLRSKCEFVIQTSSGTAEGHTHILAKK